MFWESDCITAKGHSNQRLLHGLSLFPLLNLYQHLILCNWGHSHYQWEAGDNWPFNFCFLLLIWCLAPFQYKIEGFISICTSYATIAITLCEPWQYRAIYDNVALFPIFSFSIFFNFFGCHAAIIFRAHGRSEANFLLKRKTINFKMLNHLVN